jgi:hypothetical protein
MRRPAADETHVPFSVHAYTMENLSIMGTRSRHSLLLVLLCAGCSTRNRALEIAGCDAAVVPYMTKWQGDLFGLAPYAFVKMDTHDEQAEALVSLSCVKSARFEQASYPARSLSVRPPLWWDLHSGDAVEFALLSRANQVVGVIYRKVSLGDVEWFVFANTP